VIGVSHQNLLAHNELFRTGFQMDNADQLLELYEKYNVTLHLSGHMHIQHIATEKTVTEIVQSSLSVGPFSYRILDINEESIRYRTTALDTGAWDSVRYFKDTAYGKTYDSLIDQGIDPAQAEEMSSFLRMSITRISPEPWIPWIKHGLKKDWPCGKMRFLNLDVLKDNGKGTRQKHE